MCEVNRLSLEQYLLEKNIKIIGNFKENPITSDITEDKVLEQMDAIYRFHLAAINYDGFEYKIINNKIGKTVEKYKVLLKNLKKTMKKIQSNTYINDFEAIVLKNSDIYLKRAEECMEIVNNSNYIELVKRSMKRSELCLTNTYFNNIRIRSGLEIASVKRCAYNMLEMDGVYLIRKLKRVGAYIDYNKAIDYFCKIEGFDKNSNMFMKALCSYPHEYMKCCERYRLNSNPLNIEYYEIKINNAIKRDGKSLVSEGSLC
ncbi:hypothetical protein SAMN02745134_03669 [Clostridium acidisoli DSM 12555]|uniref:Spore coat protein n=1 Tax=Clostridium acidisoli DSM 12555 TaxID=1121291 RepID=A0A1W1XY91_9CLOT|nr:hypothetical protein [Clostridium acidisoli]SMC28827.1 hypothetical protein SAMN02745134_03669 [Clostridium acidisoli DSM 12555]